ncbi:putative anion transporter chloroplastic isoform X2 [Chlorella sorokiniana]|uniref:Anion transporter chloroplastic isoform X2 n=1 Tax=Chlorella sorokiniana TaxID=3076 RepID=A0A2P6TXG6_CHLSO|nr:putative anion transporter chloroplastic isoform X2 [Chlorella sorokiniana]|eukprot:PRW58752.1 putative anion transporter chloroplastic isoform X2 [Chlorella sorokiniana]
MIKRLEKLVEQGKLSPSVLEDVRKATSPDVHHAQGVEVSPGVYKDVPAELHRREEYVFAHTPTGVPGEGRYSPNDQSIFALSGALAEPAAGRALPAHEAARLARIQAVAGEVPSVMGIKLAPPGMSPGRYMVWGSILGVAGAAGLVAVMGRAFAPEPRVPGEAPAAREPSALGERIASWFMPWRTSVTARRATRAELEAEQGEFVKRIKERMVEGRA